MPEHNENYYPVENFEYDNLDRLWYVSKGTPENPGDWEEKEIQFDSNGNILNKTGIGSYKYNAVQPHAVSEIEPQTNESGTMNIMPHHIEYNDEGKVSRIYRLPDQRFRANGPISSYIYYYYGPNTEKWESVDLKSINERIITAKTIYYFDNYEYVEDNSPYEQYFLENGVILIKKDGQLNFYQAFCDNQGSILSDFDEEGNKVFDASYDAWGKQTVTQNDIDLRYGYCGHEMLNEFGLINMTGRIYDPEIGRFISCDNFVQQPDNTQNFNRYTYCLNNPMKYVDPDGENWLVIAKIAAVAACAYGGGAVANNGQMNPTKWNYSSVGTYLGMGLGLATGAIAITTSTFGIGVMTSYGTLGAKYGGAATVTNGLEFFWQSLGGRIIAMHAYSEQTQTASQKIDAELLDLNLAYREEKYEDAKIDDLINARIKDIPLFYSPEIYDAEAKIDQTWGNITRLSEMTRPCRPGYVYHLVAKSDDLYRNVRTNQMEHLYKGETWKIGETINGEARYTKKFLKDNNVEMIPTSEPIMDKAVLWCRERLQMIHHMLEYGRLPIGNKMAK